LGRIPERGDFRRSAFFEKGRFLFRGGVLWVLRNLYKTNGGLDGFLKKQKNWKGDVRPSQGIAH